MRAVCMFCGNTFERSSKALLAEKFCKNVLNKEF
jgi:hypothetical protein